MHQQPLQQQRWPMKRTRPHSNRRMKEQRPADYEPKDQELTLDQFAGEMARGIIQHTSGVPDTTPIWRALKQAFLAGYDEASR